MVLQLERHYDKRLVGDAEDVVDLRWVERAQPLHDFLAVLTKRGAKGAAGCRAAKVVVVAVLHQVHSLLHYKGISVIRRNHRPGSPTPLEAKQGNSRPVE